MRFKYSIVPLFSIISFVAICFTAEAKKPAAAADLETIVLAGSDLKITFRVSANRELALAGIGTVDDSWKSPLGGPVFPSTPHYGGNGAHYAGALEGLEDEGRIGKSFIQPHNNGPRYAGPLEVMTATGSIGIEPLYKSHEVVDEAAGVQHLTIYLRDRVGTADLELHLRANTKYNVFEQWMVLKNTTDQMLTVPRLDSLYWPGVAHDGIYLEWLESNQKSTAGEPIRQKLHTGATRLESRDGNRHKSGPIPGFVLGFGDFPDEATVPCVVAAFDWPGSTRFSFEINNLNILEASIGVNQPGQPTVAAGGTLTSPPVFYAFSSKGKGTASRRMHRWARECFLPEGERIRLVDNNSWEGCGMRVSESAIIEMMEDSAELGIELYVLDDGWFGNGKEARVNASAGLGDWQFNEKRFPHKLDNIMKRSKELGIDFGIWFEPEMVNPKSKLYQQHPEFTMQVPGRNLSLQRNQAALDVANPAVQKLMFQSVDDVLSAYPDIRFVKWDCNSNINNPYSPFLGAKGQGNMLNGYMDGYLKVMQLLVEKHPRVDFQSCAAGGGRSNYGALRYGHTFWPSDNTNPLYRLGAQWNFSTYFPALTITSHVTHAGGDDFMPKFRFDVSMMAQLGMEVDTRKSTDMYLKAARVGINAYKGVRDIVQLGDQYRHEHPFDSATPSMNFVSKDRQRCLVLAYQTGRIDRKETMLAPVSGLDAKRVYELREINLPEGDAQPRLAASGTVRMSGADWMETGILLQFSRQFDSAALVLEAVN